MIAKLWLTTLTVILFTAYSFGEAQRATGYRSRNQHATGYNPRLHATGNVPRHPRDVEQPDATGLRANNQAPHATEYNSRPHATGLNPKPHATGYVSREQRDAQKHATGFRPNNQVPHPIGFNPNARPIGNFPRHQRDVDQPRATGYHPKDQAATDFQPAPPRDLGSREVPGYAPVVPY